MTETEWLGCTDPEPMLTFLRGKASDRKLRLFAVACCRRIWHLLDGWSQNAVDVAERHIDGLVSNTALTFATDLHSDVIQTAKPYTAPHIAAGIVNQLLAGAAWPLAWNAVSEIRRAIRHHSHGADTYHELTSQAALVRDVFGNPFRKSRWPSSAEIPKVIALAREILQNRAFNKLPTVADALEDAGCTEPYILDHCRQPGEHVRGCWVVDLLLGKE